MQIYLPSYVRAMALDVCRTILTAFCSLGLIAAAIGLVFGVYAIWLAMNGIVVRQTPLFWGLIFGFFAFGGLEVFLNSLLYHMLGFECSWSDNWLRNFPK